MTYGHATRPEAPWQPICYGNRFRIAKLVGRWQKQIEDGPYASLWAARQEADRRNGKPVEECDVPF